MNYIINRQRCVWENWDGVGENGLFLSDKGVGRQNVPTSVGEIWDADGLASVACREFGEFGDA